jgi:hypothetical protein
LVPAKEIGLPGEKPDWPLLRERDKRKSVGTSPAWQSDPQIGNHAGKRYSEVIKLFSLSCPDYVATVLVAIQSN